MEKGVLKGLSTIFEAIARADQQRKEKTEKNRLYYETNNRLVNHVYEITHKFGELKSISVGTGAGGKTIGYRLEHTTHRVTNPVEAEVDGKKIELWVVEEKTGGANYSIRSRGITIQTKVIDDSDDPTDGRRIFTIRRNMYSTNWLGEKVSIEDMDVAFSLLGYIEQRLATARGLVGE